MNVHDQWLDEEERKAVAAGKEPFDLARLEALLEATPGSYAEHEPRLRRSYYVHLDRLKTLRQLADHMLDIDNWAFWEGLY